MLDDLLLGFHEVHHLLRGQALPRPGVPLIDPPALGPGPDRRSGFPPWLPPLVPFGYS